MVLLSPFGNEECPFPQVFPLDVHRHVALLVSQALPGGLDGGEKLHLFPKKSDEIQSDRAAAQLAIGTQALGNTCFNCF